jgi:hypothetical protein
MNDKFSEVVRRFIDFADSMNAELCKDQIQSALLYASSCVTSKFIASVESAAHGTAESQISTTVEIFEAMLRNGVAHYSDDGGAV